MRRCKRSKRSQRTKPDQPDWSQLLVDAVNKPGVISTAYSRFWNYSVGNQLLAMFQCMARKIEPGPIHTFHGWQELGRHVKKGERALTLCMPVSVKRSSKHVTGPQVESVESPGNDQSETNARPETRTIFVHRPNWFVLGQTEGADYVATDIPDWSEALALETLKIVRVPFHHTDGNCQGYASGRDVSVSPIAFLPHRTLFHELAHIVLGHTLELTAGLSDADERTPRDIREVEAECTALICSESLGLPGAEFSRGYVQHWIKGQTIAEKSAQKIFKAADAILRAGRASLSPVQIDPYPNPGRQPQGESHATRNPEPGAAGTSGPGSFAS